MHGVVYHFKRVIGADLEGSDPFDEAWITFWTIQIIVRCDSNHKAVLIHCIFIIYIEGLIVYELSNCWTLLQKHILQLDLSKQEG